MHSLRSFVLAICMFGVISEGYADNRHFEVIDWCFCRSININGPTPIDCLSDPSDAKGNEKLYLWMKVTVNENGVRYLRGLDKLPIYHAWGRNGWIEGSTINIGISTQDWNNKKDGIETEIRLRNGTFDWRTYSEKVEYIYDGEHYVSVLDADRRPVVLSKDKYNAFRPKIHITAKR
jgi:hypothetical protein